MFLMIFFLHLSYIQPLQNKPCPSTSNTQVILQTGRNPPLPALLHTKQEKKVGKAGRQGWRMVKSDLNLAL